MAEKSLSQDERENCAYRLKHGAYYFYFGNTEHEGVDLILGAICAAGKGFHHTESWGDEDTGLDRSYVSLIQAAADEVAGQARAIEAAAEQMAEALRKLERESTGFMEAYESQHRATAGNTNVGVMFHWIENAREALAAYNAAKGDAPGSKARSPHQPWCDKTKGRGSCDCGVESRAPGESS